jgi:hypothetical protein
MILDTHRRPLAVRTLALTMAMAGLSWSPALGQERPHPAFDLAFGSLYFADDGVVREGFAGGAARFYLTPRLSIGPEAAFIVGGNHSHFMLTGNLTCDLLAPVHGVARRVTPFVTAGAGLFRTNQQLFSGPFSHTEGSFTAGGGVRVRVVDRVSAGVEARLGWEMHLRLNGFMTFALGRVR